MKPVVILVSLLFALCLADATANETTAPRVKTGTGEVEGVYESGISVFRGIPYGASPTGEFRWREPQPVRPWSGVRETKRFSPRCMQLPIFGDMNFRSDGMSEDCLYLNIWTPTPTPDEPLPVLVYFYGGGYMAGDGSEPRYDGASMARQGIVSLTVNYRLGAFGFMAHPELTEASDTGGSGNYGLLDQSAALRWVKDNIAAFGGDPDRVTIAGESAGSTSVSGQMMSPLSAGLFAGAIGESGSFLGTLRAATLSEAEAAGERFAEILGVDSLEGLRSVSAEKVLEATANAGNMIRFPVSVDGYFFPRSPDELYASGEVARVPLLVGWNSQEMGYQFLLGNTELTADSFRKFLDDRFGPDADKAKALYSGDSPVELAQAATDLAGDLFIAYSTWKWADLHSSVTSEPVYRYYYVRPRPPMRPEFSTAVAGLAGGIIEDGEEPKPPEPLINGAVHSAEIEYAMGNLPTNRVFDWQPEDFVVSAVMQGFFANFIKNGDPNGLALPEWPALTSQEERPVMIIDVNSRAEPAAHRERYEFLDGI